MIDAGRPAQTDPPEKIAIVAAALRMPGADSLTSYWDVLLDGRDRIVRCPDSQPDLDRTPLGLPPNARFIPAYGAISEATSFDGERFGLSPLESLLTDPQQRLLLEIVDEALFRAAVSSAERQRTGVFVGTGSTAYADEVVRHLAGTLGVDDLAVELGTARDYVAGKLAYRLDLHGPTCTVLAACSTALLAVHQGCQALLTRQVDVAVAGAAAVRFPQATGYWAAPGSISASDGVCRPFDVGATGAVPADGVGAVVLKRLDDASASGDDILAVILGSAANNDGRKPGFAQVSARGQESVIRAALHAAHVAPHVVGYIESHGAATVLGDTVEWSTLHRIFGSNPYPVYVGAVKGNVGHTREAAGIAGLLKAALSLRHGTIPPSANFDSLHPDLHMVGSALHPVRDVTEWVPDLPRRIAGVSAFGLGGSNCHVVLEPAPDPPAPTRDNSASSVVLISSHRADTLETETRAVRQLADNAAAVAAVAAHSQRRAHLLPLRRYVGLTAQDREHLSGSRYLEDHTRRAPRRPADVVFVFPGVGAEYIGMANGLMRSSDIFNASLRTTFELADHLAVDLRRVFRAPLRTCRQTTASVDVRQMVGRGSRGSDRSALSSLAARHLALFAVQVAYADTLIASGIRPSAILGHSVGEWSAAAVGHAIDRADAVRVIARRADLIEAAPRGLTAAVAAGEEAVRELLTAGTVVAADNSPQNCTVSGTPEGMTTVLSRLDDAGLVWRSVGTTAAFHSPQLESAAVELGRLLADVKLRDPEFAMVSSVTGDWVGPGDLDGSYWMAQLTSCVRFRVALSTSALRYPLLLELGPGNTGPWTRQTAPQCEVVRTAPTSYENTADSEVFDEVLATLWLHGHDPAWPTGARARRLPPIAPALHRQVFDPRTGTPPPDPDRAATTVPHGARAKCADRELGDGPAELARQLAGLWCALLRVPEVDECDHFFDLGGDSLLGRHLISAVKEITGSEVPAQVVFASNILREMALSIWHWTQQGQTR